MDGLAKKILCGIATADALGVPREFTSREDMRRNLLMDLEEFGSHFLEKGTWSDDTSLSLCTAESILNGYSLKSTAELFVRWRDEAYWSARGSVFDIGGQTNRAIHNLKMILSSGDYHKLEELPTTKDEYEFTNGNGALMRILIMILVIKGLPISEQFDIIWKSSALTHPHIRSGMSCLIYLKVAEYIIDGFEKFEAYHQTQKVIRVFWDEINFPEKERLILSDIIINDISQKSISEIGNDPYVINSLELSLYYFLNSNSFKEGVLGAINEGGDTDTNGAICGGLLSIYYNDVPEKWLNQVARIDEIIELANELDKKFGI